MVERQVSVSPAALRGARLDPARLARYAGYYEMQENQMITLVPNQEGTGLETLADGLPDETFLAIDSVRFGSAERGIRIALAPDPRGVLTGVVWRAGEGAGERLVARVAPLPSTQAPAPDADPALTTRVTADLQAPRQGGSALRDALDIPPGTKHDFAGGVGTALDGLGTLSWLGDEDVSGRGIHRHGADVAQVRYYRVTTSAGQRYLLVHLTAEGSVADFDVVDR